MTPEENFFRFALSHPYLCGLRFSETKIENQEIKVIINLLQRNRLKEFLYFDYSFLEIISNNNIIFIGTISAEETVI